MLWTRYRSSEPSAFAVRLRVEISEDESFNRVIATADAKVSPAADWTCRVLVGHLQPARTYWYRFIDPQGYASRVGRTRTAPAPEDTRPVNFAFVSCQNITLGAQHAYRRMIFEDQRAAEEDQLGFVLHLGDFIYEIVPYPEDNPQGLWGRPVREVVRLPQGEKVDNFHIPTTLEDYRTLYRAYLQDPDIQDARARWPFVCMWDNCEFSRRGWQSLQTVNGVDRPRQALKVAANQAWFEYQPARIVKASGNSLDTFDPPRVRQAPIERFDEHGLGMEANNRAAIGSLTAYRALRWGAHVDLILTDQYSYRSREPSERPEAQAFKGEHFPQLFPQEALEILDAGRAYANGQPPPSIRHGEQAIANFRRAEPPQTVLGAEQKAWLLETLRRSRATWKVWGCSSGTLEYRADPQNLPAGLAPPWPGAGYATVANRDLSCAYQERAEIYNYVRQHQISGFATVCGDRHAFWAGLAAPSLPPRAFEPVGVAFITGSICTPGLVEILQANLAAKHPLRGLYLAEQTDDAAPKPVLNLLFRHGVRSSLEYQRTGDIERARRLSNPDLSPHLSFLDLGGHGYSIARASGDRFECEFVCIPSPIEQNRQADGGPLLYRIKHGAPLWKSGQTPRLEQQVIEGNPELSI